MIFFEKVKLQNFLSIGEEPIELQFKTGLNLIVGLNKDKSDRSNGSGKTTILDGIYYAIKGKTIRNLNKSDIVNKKIKKNTIVELYFKDNEDSYLIVRGIKPSKLELYKNGKNITRDSINNTQSDIDRILGVSENIIQNSIIMGATHVPFMAQSKIDKRKYIEGIFDLELFTEMLKLCRKDYNEAEKLLTSLTTKETEQTKNLKVYREQSENHEQKKKEKIGELENIIKAQKNKIKEKEDGKKNINEDELILLGDKNGKLNTVLEKKILPVIGKLQEDKQNHISNIKFIKEDIDNTFNESICPTCKRPLSEHDKEKIEEHIKEKKNKIKTLHDKTIELNKKIDEVKEKQNKIVEARNNVQEKIRSIKEDKKSNELIDKEIAICNDNLKYYDIEIRKLIKEDNTLDIVIERVAKELKDTQKEIDTCGYEIKVYEQLKFILSENGVKSYIMNKMLNILNQKINYYLSKLNANCKVEFDEFFQENIINEKKQDCSYYNFSNGERRNIDIAVMFAFMDLQKIKGTFECNLACYDELIDIALDEDGIKLVLDILKEIVENENKAVYLISHRSEANKYATGEIITIEKRNGFSNLKM